jgi:hypothetical protein
MVWDESILVTERRNGIMLTESALMQQTISAILGGKKGADALKKTTAQLNVEAVPIGSPGSGTDEGQEEWRAGMSNS